MLARAAGLGAAGSGDRALAWVAWPATSEDEINRMGDDDEAMEAEWAAAAASPTPNRGLLTHVTRRAMATDFVVFLPEHAAEKVEVVFATLEQLDGIEQSLTIYRDDSEISRVNRLACQQPVKVSEPTFELIEKSLLWSQRTAGAFDVTAGPLVEAWGFNTRSGRKPSPEQIETARASTGYEAITLSRSDRTVRFAKPGMSINLGAIGKGDALDRLALRLRQQGVCDFLIHGGNSSVIAAGDQTAASGLGWAVGVSHPTKPKRRLGGLWLRDAALATSGSGKQFFHHRGKRYGHVIDPRTGQPAGDLMSLTVVMPSAADADACATGLFVAGSRGIEQHREQDWMPAVVMVRPGERQDQICLDCIGEIPWVDPPENPVSQSDRVSQD